jgi:hypothetical protein
MNFNSDYDLDLVSIRHNDIRSEVTRARLAEHAHPQPRTGLLGLRTGFDRALVRLSEGAVQRQRRRQEHGF